MVGIDVSTPLVASANSKDFMMKGKDSPVSGDENAGTRGGVWDPKEHEQFLKCLNEIPAGCKNRWKLISTKIKTRTSTQVRTHAQKYFKKLKLQKERKIREQQQLYNLQQVQFVHEELRRKRSALDLMSSVPLDMSSVFEDPFDMNFEIKRSRSISTPAAYVGMAGPPSLHRSVSEPVNTPDDVSVQFSQLELNWLVESLTDDSSSLLTV